MTLMKNNQLLNIRIKATLSKLLLVLLPHLITGIVLLIFIDLSGLTLIYFAISMLLIIVSLIYFIKLHLTLDLKKSIVTLHKDLNDNWSVKYKDKTTAKVSICAASFVSDLLLLINVKDKSQQDSTVLITRDSVSQDQFRQLKVFIRTHKLAD